MIDQSNLALNGRSHNRHDPTPYLKFLVHNKKAKGGGGEEWKRDQKNKVGTKDLDGIFFEREKKWFATN